MSEFSASAPQVVAPGGSIVFDLTTVPCTNGLINHEPGSGNFLMKGSLQNGFYGNNNNDCCCGGSGVRSSLYDVDFKANIAVDEGGTPGEISVAFALDGGILTTTTMRQTPTAASAYSNISTDKIVNIFGGCCQNLTIVNTSTQAILVAEPLLTFNPA
jgi:hypothetical protein